MPSISQAKLDELNHNLEWAESDRVKSLEARHAAEARTRNFDDILDKIMRAAQGRPLMDDRNGYGVMGSSLGMSMSESRLTEEERAELQWGRLQEQLTDLRCQLASVVAVAQFAKVYKV